MSVVVLTHNEEANIEACLRSIAGFDAWVVDCGSSDDTVGIAESMGAQVVHHAWEGYARQRQWAMANLPLREWTFWLDADERPDPQLRAEIERFVADPQGASGAWVLRELVFLGKPIRHGGVRRYHLRVARRQDAFWDFSELDEKLAVGGPTTRLRGLLVHEDRRGLRVWVERHVQYAQMHPPEPWLYRSAPRGWRALALLVYRLVIQAGALDGPEGLIYHGLQGFSYRLLREGLMMEEKIRRASYL